MSNKYQREIKPGVFVDVYDVLKAFDVTCPAMAHGIKKCLAPGQRGVKDSIQDKREAIVSINRSIEMEQAPNTRFAIYRVEKDDYFKGYEGPFPVWGNQPITYSRESAEKQASGLKGVKVEVVPYTPSETTIGK